MRSVTNPNLAIGRIWQLHHEGVEIARLTVTGTDMPWVYATVEALSGFEQFRPIFAEQEQALDTDDWDQVDTCYEQIRSSLTISFPDGEHVAEFMVNIHDDGTASWRWHDEVFETDAER